jgi:hypothetical protein
MVYSPIQQNIFENEETVENNKLSDIFLISDLVIFGGYLEEICLFSII